MKLAEAYVDITTRTSKFMAGLSRLRTKLTAGLRRMSVSVTRWAKRIGIALAGAFTAAIWAATKFETQMANVSTMLTETTMPAMVGFEKGIKELAVVYGQSTETLTQGLYDILSASIAAGQAMNVLETSSRAAIAGMTETAEAVDVITTLINSYQLSARDADRVSDALFATVKAGKLRFADLSRFLGMVAAPAAASGASMEELLAGIATLTRAGVRPRIAMTNLRQAFMAFAKSTPDAKKAAEEIGLVLETETLRTLGLTGVLKKLEGATVEQMAAIFSSVEAYNAMIILKGDIIGFTRDLTGQMNALGSTTEAYNKMAVTMGFWFKRLRQQVVVLAADIGRMFLPALKAISKHILDNKDKIKDFVVNALSWLWNNTIRVISRVVFEFKNFSSGVKLATDLGTYYWGQFTETLKHFFTVQLPELLKHGALSLHDWFERDVGEWIGKTNTQIILFHKKATAQLTQAQYEAALEQLEAEWDLRDEFAKRILKLTERRVSAEAKAEKAALDKRLADRQATYKEYFDENWKAWLHTVDTASDAEDRITSDAEDGAATRTAIAKQEARDKSESAFLGLEEAWKRAQLAALNIKAPTIGAKAPEVVQQKQLMTLDQIKKQATMTVEWLKKLFEKQEGSAVNVLAK